jgi:hypothetical protein
MFITTFAQNYSQNAGNAIFQRHKNGATACPQAQAQTHKEMPGFRLK